MHITPGTYRRKDGAIVEVLGKAKNDIRIQEVVVYKVVKSGELRVTPVNTFFAVSLDAKNKTVNNFTRSK